MTNRIPKLTHVSVIGPTEIFVKWDDETAARIDLADWIETGSHILEPLKNPDIFATAKIGGYDRHIEWNGSDDLAIDSWHLKIRAGMV